MKRCYNKSPPIENVFYAIEVKTDLQEEFIPIVEELIMKKKEAPYSVVHTLTAILLLVQEVTEGKAIQVH